MTNLEAIRGRLGYPLTDNSFTLALTNHDLTASGIYLAKSESFELAYAEAIVILLTSPQSIDEGGFKLTKTESKTLLAILNGIYTTYGVVNPLVSLNPTAQFVRRW